MAQIFLALNFGEMGALESAENSDFFHVMQNLYAQSAQNLTSDQPPPSYMEPLLNASLWTREDKMFGLVNIFRHFAP